MKLRKPFVDFVKVALFISAFCSWNFLVFSGLGRYLWVGLNLCLPYIFVFCGLMFLLNWVLWLLDVFVFEDFPIVTARIWCRYVLVVIMVLALGGATYRTVVLNDAMMDLYGQKFCASCDSCYGNGRCETSSIPTR